ncbi:TetR/AcrR family transcriptional regulator [Luteimicrobium sp. DT211]|uniref:TetR/AcrR family transcriptional regulator n=1 Tax=Luteimicrobium sp. DT211 TaxID=3393412 RepID=UPI003CF06D42
MSRTATAGPEQATDRRTARERLLDAADDLFYAEGIHTVGIDRIIESAGVAKASLYSTFGSKDELVRAYLAVRHDRIQARVERHVAAHTDPRDRVLAVFDAQAERFAEPDYRGCAFTAAAAESPSGSAAVEETERYRGWLLGVLTDLTREAGARDPEALARRLQMIYDGAGLAFRIDHLPTAGQESRDVAAALLDAALA